MVSFVYGLDPSESLTVRVESIVPDVWAANSLGHPATIVRLVDPRHEDYLSTVDRGIIGSARRRAERSDLPVAASSGSMLVDSSDLEPMPPGLLPLYQISWRGAGECPSCGHTGEWVNLAQRCPYHGVF